MYSHVLPGIDVYSHVLPHIDMYSHVSLCTAMYSYVLPDIAIHSHVLLCIAMCTYRRYRILLQHVNKDISTFSQRDLCRKPALLSPCSMIRRYNLYACWLLPFSVNPDYYNLYIYRDECKFADSLSRSTLICQIACRMQCLSALETFCSGCLTRFGTPLIIKNIWKSIYLGHIFKRHIHVG